MLENLPVEIQVRVLKLSATSSLKLVNSHFYVLYNELYYDKILKTFGSSINNILIKVLPWLVTYIKSLDTIRYQGRKIIESKLKLGESEKPEDQNPLSVPFVKDSWKYIYSLLRNKRLFAEYSDYKIDEPTNYIFNHFVEINRTYLLSYTKTMWLAPGTYNLNIGLVVKHGSGLGTTKFEISYESDNGSGISEVTKQAFYAPTNINEILPKKQFCLLKLGDFIIPNTLTSAPNKLTKITLVMEEIGLYLKSGFRIFFIDLSQYSTLYNDFDLLYYSVKETDYRYFINIPLKNFYKALNYVQEGGDNTTATRRESEEYGSGDPNDISTYEVEYSIPNVPTTKDLQKYASFYFYNQINSRYFQFNTIYQRRQFVNKFGDFLLDLKEEDEHKIERTRTCSYDQDGLKWKIPVIGEL